MLFAAAFLLSLFHGMFSIEQIVVVTKDECIKDYTFVWTSTANGYLSENIDFKNKYIIYCSLMMDFMIISFMGFFLLYWKTYRVLFAYILFFGLRIFI